MADLSFKEKFLRGMIGFENDYSELDKAEARTQLAYKMISVFDRRGLDFKSGQTRITFIGKDFVYKIPRNYPGIQANLSEAKYYRSEGKKFPVAACRIIYLDDDKLLPILIMERVEPIWSPVQKPEWANRIDGGQVGINRKAEIVAYDL